MKAHTVMIENAEQSVRDLIADLLETFSEQIQQGDAPKIHIEYFGATFEVNLLEFKGIDLHR
ncbi:hypothetical protein [Vibrio viridaestus]|uniref:Uncharacterized protein n=1 Tax=Vibrio viridaestus TaxID=2487322 RepID=A0A3N9TGJ3_9VIBR|nr:hypothetical protein [Vibrio viridaestus]RQW62595.1 hypothetical protein EES38_12785 [Vibrio viridaestus]